MTRRLLAATTAALCLLLAGCRHKPPPLSSVTLAPVVPVPLDSAPPPKSAQQIAPVPVATAPLPDKSVLLKKPRKPRRKVVAPPVAAAPVQTASIQPSAGSPVASVDVVGALTTGGDANPGIRQKAADLLTALERRLNALSTAELEQQKEQVARIRYFGAQAHAALLAGDADGAFTLATKAKVLLDDFSK